MLRNLVVAISLMALFFSCSSQKSTSSEEGKTIISGKVLEESEPGDIVLSKFGDGELSPMDTTTTGENGEFKFEVEHKHPGLYIVNVYDKKRITLVLDSADVHIETTTNKNDDYKVTGSQPSKDIKNLLTLADAFSKSQRQLQRKFMEARKSGDQSQLQQIRAQAQKMRSNFHGSLKDSIRNMAPSMAGLFGMQLMDQSQHVAFADSIAGIYQNARGDVPLVKNLVDNVKSLKSLQVGNEAPNLKLANPEGDTVSLHSLRGKVVLIDFWAAWCKPCRVENPKVVDVYEKYHDKGFEIYGVSLDRKKEDWVKAIKKDGLPWIHVSDLQHYNSKAAEKYNVNAIPFTVLLDREGKIIAKGLRAEGLRKELEKIFDS